MGAIVAVEFETPDGVKRWLRFTLGARRRIAERFKEPNIGVILQRIGDGVLPEIAYHMMYDEEGKPPDLNLARFAESLADATPLLAAIMSAATNGASPKNEIEALLRKAQEEEVAKLIGSTFGPSGGSASDSPTPNSGTSPSANSTPSVTDSTSASESPTTEAA